MASRWDVASRPMRAVMIATPLAFLGAGAAAFAATDWSARLAFLALFYLSAGVMAWLTMRKHPSNAQ
jgi:hypothetical protein